MFLQQSSVSKLCFPRAECHAPRVKSPGASAAPKVRTPPSKRAAQAESKSAHTRHYSRVVDVQRSPGVFTFAPINNLTCKYADENDEESFLHAPPAQQQQPPCV